MRQFAARNSECRGVQGKHVSSQPRDDDRSLGRSAPRVCPSDVYDPSESSLCEDSADDSRYVNADPIDNRRTQSDDNCEKLFESHLPIVRYVARKMHNRLPHYLEIDDLVSAGAVGLMEAITKFDPSKNVQFRNYAAFRIHGAILDHLRTLDWGPRSLRRKGRLIEEATQRLTGRFGRSPSDDEIAEEMSLSLRDYQSLVRDLKGLEIGALDAVSSDEHQSTAAVIAVASADDPLLHCLRAERSGRVADAIAQLPERERAVIRLYYFEERTQGEIGCALGVAHSRISRIHSSAIEHLRKALYGSAELHKNRPKKDKRHAIVPTQNNNRESRELSPSAVRRIVSDKSEVLLCHRHNEAQAIILPHPVEIACQPPLFRYPAMA